jgi:hypothetical protein
LQEIQILEFFESRITNNAFGVLNQIYQSLWHSDNKNITMLTAANHGNLNGNATIRLWDGTECNIT